MQSHRIRFPNDEITLVSNFEDFSKDAQEYVIQFCQRFRIKLMGFNEIQTKIKKSITLKDREEQLALLNVARLEITHDCGNLAAASDIIRILSPIVECGIYTDFDMIKIKQTATEITPPLGFLLDGDFQGKELSIDKLSNAAFVCDESATSFLQVYRGLILAGYYSMEIISALAGGEESIFNTDEYHQAQTLMHESGKVESALPLALQFRAALKKSCTPTNYEKALKGLIEAISGPKCMNAVLGIIIEKEFRPFCVKHKLNAEKLRNAFENFSLVWKCFFSNEDDVSWLPSLDNRKERWNIMTKAATTIQSLFRMQQAKIVLTKLKEEEKERQEAQQLATTSAGSAPVVCLHVLN